MYSSLSGTSRKEFSLASPSQKLLAFLNSKVSAGTSSNVKSQKSSSSSSSSSINQKKLPVAAVQKKNDKPAPPPDGFAAARGEESIVRGTQDMNIGDVGDD